MEGKRSYHVSGENEPKRAKTAFPLEITLQGVEYTNLSCLLKAPPFSTYLSKFYNKSQEKFIEVEQVETFNVSKKNVAQGVFSSKAKFSYAHDLRLVRSAGKIKDFICRVRSTLTPRAPPILADEDLAFTDALGKTYSVEMRGERTEEGIYFKVKDIGEVFERSNLADNTRHKHTQLNEYQDYVWFEIPVNERKENDSSREIFFTHEGMVAAIFISKSRVAKQFRKWVSQIVFTHRHGTTELKQRLARSLLNKKTIDEVTKRCANDIACVYLLETKKTSLAEDGVTRRVYKFGYSKNMKDRMDKLVVKYGHESVIDTLMFLPLNHLSEAETKLKRTLGTKYTHDDGTETELLLLSPEERNTVRMAMRTVGETYYGETVVHAHQLEMVKKDHELALSKMNLELNMAKKDLEIAKKDITISIQNGVQTQRIRQLEEELRGVAKVDVTAAYLTTSA